MTKSILMVGAAMMIAAPAHAGGLLGGLGTAAPSNASSAGASLAGNVGGAVKGQVGGTQDATAGIRARSTAGAGVAGSISQP